MLVENESGEITLMLALGSFQSGKVHGEYHHNGSKQII
jgi:hypothetical protein